MRETNAIVDVWEPAGDWTRALARHLPNPRAAQWRSVKWWSGSGAFTPVSPSHALAPISLIVAIPDNRPAVLPWTADRLRQPAVQACLVALQDRDDGLRAALRALGVLYIADNYWQASDMARLMLTFCAAQPQPVLSLEQRIWKNLPWNE